MRQFFSYPVFILCIAVFISSCQDESKEKKADIPKDSTTAGTGNGNLSKDSSTIHIDSSSVSAANANDKTKAGPAAQPSLTDAKSSTDKSKTDAAIPAKKVREAHENDKIPKTVTPAQAGTNSAPPADNTKIQSPDNIPTATEKPFVYKYGIIPWDATADNITSFKNAFPDKQTNVRINFDNDPDAAMQDVKTKIMKALHDAGYTNVDAQSKTFHPARIPKDIHYELQHDGTVIIWLPPVNNQ
ncbi:MAG: hypothetical protein JST96_04880 [Bacteroidetes bacterium]|nr:hypothetical protein [Bacteroidota bacterium]